MNIWNDRIAVREKESNRKKGRERDRGWGEQDVI